MDDIDKLRAHAHRAIYGPNASQPSVAVTTSVAYYEDMTTPSLIEEVRTWAQTPRTEPIDSNLLIVVANRLQHYAALWGIR